MGFDTGTTSCSTECLIELSGCVRFSCGDGVVDEDEACDDGADNGTYGNCNGNCSGLAAHCGDGVANGGEECDGSDLRGSTCSSVGFDAGSLSCDATCDLVTTQCRVSYCGDGVVDSGESCDEGSGTELPEGSCGAEACAGDLGVVDEPDLGVDTDDGGDGGCSCRVAAPRDVGAGLFWLLTIGLFLRRRRSR